MKAVVGYTPSGVVWGGIGEGDAPAWTFRGEAFPYLRMMNSEEGGHMLIPYPFYPSTMRQFYLPTVRVWEGLGGTAEGAAEAAGDS